MFQDGLGCNINKLTWSKKVQQARPERNSWGLSSESDMFSPFLIAVPKKSHVPAVWGCSGQVKLYNWGRWEMDQSNWHYTSMAVSFCSKSFQFRCASIAVNFVCSPVHLKLLEFPVIHGHCKCARRDPARVGQNNKHAIIQQISLLSAFHRTQTQISARL